jgi:hypothetical protein
MENSLFTCDDGSVNEPDCKLDTKPQPQWDDNWLDNNNRKEIYNNWSRIIDLKINEDVFEGNYNITSGSLTPIVYIWDDNISSSELKNVVILANFDVVDQTVTPYFPYSGTWFDLMDEEGETTFNVTSTNDQITLLPGEFKIYGNQASTTLSNTVFEDTDLILSPNPSVDFISINRDAELMEIYDITGKILLSFTNVTRNQQLEINQLQTGYYIVKVYRDKYVETRNLIKK